MIKLQEVSLQLGTKVLLEKANLNVFPGHKLGIIGANGSGKSTLFKLLLSELVCDGGEVNIPKGWRISHMAQEIHHIDRSALDHVLDGDTEFRELENAIHSGDVEGEALGELYGKMEAIEGYSAQARAQRLLNGLGFKPGDELRSVKDFSGGWRIRLNLAQALMCRSDLLLLDEPTNHLDLDACIWLEQHLRQYAGTLLIISHDRDFLDNVVQGIVSFDNAQLVEYSGNYSAYERQKAERLAQQDAAFQKQQARIGEIENFVRRFKAKASKAKQAQSRLKELERMEKIAPAHVDSPFTFRFPEPEKTSQQLINLSQASIGYNHNALIEGVNLSILSQSRIGLLGHNGAGKSTLVKSLADDLALIEGERAEGTHLKVAYFAQHQLESLDLKASCALHIQRISPKASEQEIRNFLGAFGFHGDRAFEVIEHFSGGEKARLALALLAWQKPNLLLLDEPTNHLDLEMRQALSMALQVYEGAIVLVSHDRYLLRNAVDEFLLVDAGKVVAFDGDLSTYQQWLLNNSNDTDTNSEEKNTANDKGDKKSQRQAAALLREQLKPLTQKLKKIEKEMEDNQKSLEKTEAELADPALYDGPSDKMQSLLKVQGQLKQIIETLEEEWLVLSEEIETAKAGMQ